MSPSEAHLQVTMMCRMNLIQRGGAGRYGLVGSRQLDLTAATRAMGIVRQARVHLVNLQQLTGCPVTLAMLDGAELVVVDRAVAQNSAELEMAIDLYPRLPVHATALGKVLLAYLPEHREHALVSGLELDALTPYTITCRTQLLTELQEVRSSGLAREDREHLLHGRCIAAPVRGAHNQVIAAVGIVLADAISPLEELARSHRDQVGRTAEQLSAALRFAELDGSDLGWPIV